ncbi:MAG TPA: phosphodiester glycosidase family protein [Thermoanaerobaculia bacterium]|nr:phosphodiester glycosidase family protein [Thermoanaerobaculia bacterium]
MKTTRLLLAFTLVTLTVGAPLLADCGQDNELPCITRTVAESNWCYGFQWGNLSPATCWEDVQSCTRPNSAIDPNDGLCHTLGTPRGLTCCTAVSFSANGYPVTQGYYANADLRLADIVVPNRHVPNTCTQNSQFVNRLESIPDWFDDYTYKTRLKINANFFEVKMDSGGDGNPYFNDCTTALGLAVSNGSTASPDSPVHGVPTQTLVFFTAAGVQQYGYEAVIAPNAGTTYQGKIQNAISGYRLLQDGQYVPQPEAITPALYRPRTAVALTRDNNTLILVVVNPGNDAGNPTSGGTTMPALSDYLVSLGAWNALTLDGSGSSQFLYDDLTQQFRSLPADDVDGRPGKQFRPVPVFLGIR